VAEGTTLPTFYATATAVLIALLITWLVTEARELRDKAAPPATPPIADASSSGRLQGAWIVGIAALMSSAAIVALRVQYHESAQSWEKIYIWAALGFGFVGVALSTAIMVASAGSMRPSDAAVKAFRAGRRLLPIAAAVIVGVIAAPERVRREGARFPVYGTCLTGGCGLKQHTRPNPSSAVSADRLKDGARILVVCQVEGPAPPGVKSRVWDRLPTGLYVSDAFVFTPASGRFSSILPRCKDATTKTAGWWWRRVVAQSYRSGASYCSW
jgi:hypothetical protein